MRYGGLLVDWLSGCQLKCRSKCALLLLEIVSRSHLPIKSISFLAAVCQEMIWKSHQCSFFKYNFNSVWFQYKTIIKKRVMNYSHTIIIMHMRNIKKTHFGCSIVQRHFFLGRVLGNNQQRELCQCLLNVLHSVFYSIFENFTES